MTTETRPATQSDAIKILLTVVRDPENPTRMPLAETYEDIQTPKIFGGPYASKNTPAGIYPSDSPTIVAKGISLAFGIDKDRWDEFNELAKKNHLNPRSHDEMFVTDIQLNNTTDNINFLKTVDQYRQWELSEAIKDSIVKSNHRSSTPMPAITNATRDYKQSHKILVTVSNQLGLTPLAEQFTSELVQLPEIVSKAALGQIKEAIREVVINPGPPQDTVERDRIERPGRTGGGFWGAR